MRQLLEAGVYFGHSIRRWNPRMAPYLYSVRNGTHIIDLEQTVPLLHRGLLAISDVVAGGGRVLLVGAKRRASEKVADAARRRVLEAAERTNKDDAPTSCLAEKAPRSNLEFQTR